MKKLLLASFALFIVLSSCKKSLVPSEGNQANPDLENNVNQIGDMLVPKGFEYKATKLFSLTVTPDPLQPASEIRVVEVYTDNPRSNGVFLGKYSLRSGVPLVQNFTIPTALEKLYIVVVSANGTSVGQRISSVSGSASINLGSLLKKSLGKTLAPSVSCNTGCTSTASGSNQNLFINNASSVVCITRSFSGNIDLNNGTLRICGEAEIGTINLNNSSTLLISKDAKVKIGNINLNTATTSFTNWSDDVELKNTFSPNGVVTNNGELKIGGSMNINGNANFINNGFLDIENTLNINKGFTNSGLVEIGGDLNNNGGAVSVNNCQILVDGNLTLNNPFAVNGGLFNVKKNLVVNGNGNLNLRDGSMVTCDNATFNHIAEGFGTPSLIRVEKVTVINGGGNLKGNLTYCDKNGIETKWGTIANTVTENCDLYIPVSDCNNLGNGEPVKVDDDDKDGVANKEDQFPADPSKSYSIYYPSQVGFASVAFEDLWPSKGDYDLNDLVVDFRHQLITNASNEVVEIISSVRLRASGGTQAIAFNLGYPVDPSNIEKIEGAKSEEGHKNLVVMVFDNSKTELGGWNTVMSQSKVPFKEYQVNITLAKPVPMAEFGSISEFDPFIWVNQAGKGRGYEIHLPGKQPTALADTKLFGYADDNTNVEEGTTYVTKNNLPWAVLVPEEYAYCIELRMLPNDLKAVPDITQVYLKFAQWAQSGGKFYTDWYRDLPGYRSSEYLYNK
ncbi:MAG: LruC domain-containing protein [Bacteroidia bacterium]|nr:LruC domain-containing protein [Bacteroidia bacterium]